MKYLVLLFCITNWLWAITVQECGCGTSSVSISFYFVIYLFIFFWCVYKEKSYYLMEYLGNIIISRIFRNSTNFWVEYWTGANKPLSTVASQLHSLTIYCIFCSFLELKIFLSLLNCLKYRIKCVQVTFCDLPLITLWLFDNINCLTIYTQ